MTATDLFDWADGAIRRDRGMALANEAQERDAPGWAGRAYAAIVFVARRDPEVFVDAVLLIFREKPHHHNAWAIVWRRAIKDGVITRTSESRQTADPAKRAHWYPVYASNIYAQRHNERMTA